MAYFRKLTHILDSIDAKLESNESWLILINADPDAIACALALKTLLGKKVKKVEIAHINKITRPDNLTMIRLLHIPMFFWDSELKSNYQRFAIVDSQPHHSPAFSGIDFDLIIDHHPVTEQSVASSEQTLSYILPDRASCASFLTELLYNAKIKIGKNLATALQYGIRVDTGSFGRRTTELDLRAYHYLSRFADHTLLMHILRSEYFLDWLPYFAKAIENLIPCHSGNICFIGDIDSSDILVVVADFFQKIHGLQWVAVAAKYENTLICVFRGNGKVDLGKLASKAFGKFGSAGGHRQMARAEIPQENISAPIYEFICASFDDAFPKSKTKLLSRLK